MYKICREKNVKKIYKYAIYRPVRKVSVDEEERYYRI